MSYVSLTGQRGPEVVALAKQIRADLIVVGAQDESSPGPRLDLRPRTCWCMRPVGANRSTCSHFLSNDESDGCGEAKGIWQRHSGVLMVIARRRYWTGLPVAALQNEMTMAD